jgi:cytochrome P450
LVELESNPSHGSRFFASAYASVLGLPDDHEPALQQLFESHLTRALDQKLTLAHQPEPDTTEAQAWAAERRAFFDQSHAEVRALLPANKQIDFDRLVETGAYGFRGVRINGERLGFSLGGD